MQNNWRIAKRWGSQQIFGTDPRSCILSLSKTTRTSPCRQKKCAGGAVWSCPYGSWFNLGHAQIGATTHFQTCQSLDTKTLNEFNLIFGNQTWRPRIFRIIHGNVSLLGGSRGLPICADWIKLWLGEHHQASMILVLQSSTIWQEEHDFRIFPDRISICSCRIFVIEAIAAPSRCAKSMIYILEHDLEVSKSWGYYQIIYFHRIFQ